MPSCRLLEDYGICSLYPVFFFLLFFASPFSL
uniref:Uncharacterized protein n=1 Tax=Anguilla anguilla TaxID=7936 RepID=A0A0E9TSY5_ANGAN